MLQSYLYRTEEDARAIMKIPARIRLCKGAYDKPAEVADPEKRMSTNYVRVMQMLLMNHHDCNARSKDD